MHFDDADDFYSFIEDINARSIFLSETQVTFDDQLVFMATCTPTGSVNERLIIVGKLVEIG